MLIRNAEELQGYSRSEEDRLEALIKGIADSGAKVVVAGSAIGEMALHFVEKYGLMALRIPSKFDLRRFCRCACTAQGIWQRCVSWRLVTQELRVSLGGRASALCP